MQGEQRAGEEPAIRGAGGGTGTEGPPVPLPPAWGAAAHPVHVHVARRHEMLLEESGLAGCEVGAGSGGARGPRAGLGLLEARDQRVSPPGNPTATTTSGSWLKRELDSGR